MEKVSNSGSVSTQGLDHLQLKNDKAYLAQLNGESPIASWKMSGIDEKNLKYITEVVLTETTLILFRDTKLFEMRNMPELEFIVYSLLSNEFIVQFKKESSLRFITTRYRNEVIRTLLKRLGIIRKKIPLYFVDEISLGRFVTSEAMLMQKLEVDMSESDYELMDEAAFTSWESAEESFKNDTEDRTTTLFTMDKNKNQVVKLEDFKILKLLGRGGFGKVMLCQKSSDGKLYAMKILRKKDIVESDQVEHTKAEKAILTHVNHPFLVSLEAAFQNKRKIYFVMELMRGGEIYTHLARQRRFTEQQTKFFSACICLALGHLHANNFIYRDVKLENILLDSQGFAKLTDFGLSKFLKKDEITHTVCGTVFYIAPEIIANNGYSYPADWWSLGILTYELLFGFPPFYSKNQRVLMKIIKEGQIVFHEKYQISDEAKDFITKLLAKDPSQRLGSSADSLEVMSHPWFKNINWSYLMERKCKPPYQPSCDDSNWLDNFDQEFTSQDGELVTSCLIMKLIEKAR